MATSAPTVAGIWIVNERAYQLTKPEDVAAIMALATLGSQALQILETYDMEDEHAMATALLAIDEKARTLQLIEAAKESTP